MIDQERWQWFSRQLAEFDDRLEFRRTTPPGDGEDSRATELAELETAREELRVAEEELRSQQEELVSALERPMMPATNGHLLDDLPVAALATDKLGVLTSVNRQAAQLFGELAPRQAGKPLAAYISGDRKPFRQLLGRLASGDHDARCGSSCAAGPGQRCPRWSLLVVRARPCGG